MTRFLQSPDDPPGGKSGVPSLTPGSALELSGEPRVHSGQHPASSHRWRMLAEPLVLGEPVYAADAPVRFHARGELSLAAYEVLVLGDDDPRRALVVDRGAELCGWDYVVSHIGDDEVLVFRRDAVLPLRRAVAQGADPVEVLAALASLLESLHVLGEALVVHAAWDWFGVRADGGDPLTAVFTRPELLREAAVAGPVEIGQLGLSAPETTGNLSRDIDARADVFLLGLLGYHLLTEVPPEPSIADRAWSLPPLRALMPRAPIGLDRILARCVSRLPEDRYAGVPEFMEALFTMRARHTLRRVIGTDRRVRVEHASHSETGTSKVTRHPVNQDNHLSIADPRAGWSLFSVMDGVSTADVGTGEHASYLAGIELETQWNQKRGSAIYGRRFDAEHPFPERFVHSLVERAHLRVAAQGALDIGAAGGGPMASACTTLSVVACFGDRCLVASVGDSPVYLLSDQGLDKLTVDHTVPIVALRRGAALSEVLDEVDSALGAAVGHLMCDGDDTVPADVSADILAFRIFPGDVVLLCSDGIPDAFGREAERAILGAAADLLAGEVTDAGRLLAFVRRLVMEADTRGGRDNLTAVAVGIGDYRGDHAET